MAEKTYVQLTKAQEDLQNITQGELNEPIDIHKVTGRRCEHCRQILPKSYQPPEDEDWSTGIFGCMEDVNSCRTGLFCPCVLYGSNNASLNEDESFRNACMGHGLCFGGGITVAAAATCLALPTVFTDPLLTMMFGETLCICCILACMPASSNRLTLQRKYHLKNSPCDPECTHCWLHSCALCQEYREMKNRISNDLTSKTTIVNPPPMQEMKTIGEKEEAAGSSSTN